MLTAEVYITLKKTVADPQGLTVRHSLESLGYQGLGQVRMGKMICLELDTNDVAQAEKQINEMCQTLLANPIIEDYRINIKEK